MHNLLTIYFLLLHEYTINTNKTLQISVQTNFIKNMQILIDYRSERDFVQNNSRN